MEEKGRPETLASLLAQEGRLPLAKALQLARALLGELRKLHADGVIHRNLHPGCVRLDPGGGVTLAGLELARTKNAPNPPPGGEMSGAIRTMAPEQVLGGPTDERTDVYQAGLIFYRLMTGKPAFEAQGAWSLARKVSSEDPVPPSIVDPEVPRALSDLILKALSRNAADRFSSAAEFAEALSRIR